MGNLRLVLGSVVFIKLVLSLGAPLSAESGQTAASLTGGVLPTTGGGSTTDVRYIDLMTAPELAGSRPELSKLASIYAATEMRFKLEQSRHLTILMPSNRAIDRAARHGIDLAHTTYQVSLPILQFFIIPEVIKVSQLAPGTHVFQSIEGSELTFLKPQSSNKPVTVNGESIGFQIDNANGVAYILDSLIYPESLDVEAVRAHKRSRGHPHTPDVPEYVEQTNVAHSRYDRSPVNQPAQIVEVADGSANSHGVLHDDSDLDPTEEYLTGEENVAPGAGVLPAPVQATGRKSHVVESNSPDVQSPQSVRRRRWNTP